MFCIIPFGYGRMITAVTGHEDPANLWNSGNVNKKSRVIIKRLVEIQQNIFFFIQNNLLSVELPK